MSKNSIVQKGWYYRRSPIIQETSPIGIIIDAPVWSLALSEKLTYSKKTNSYSVVDIHDQTFTVNVLWNNNLVENCSLRNLVEVK